MRKPRATMRPGDDPPTPRGSGLATAAIDAGTDFDAGPLSWVLPEIEQSLARGLEALARFRAGPADSSPLRHAQAHVHQAIGAIQMVGLDALAPYTEEIERALARLATVGPADIAPGCDAIDRACRKLRIVLSGVVAGSPLLALELFPEYEAMQAARGIRLSAASDLFYPDLAARGPAAAPAVPPAEAAAQMVRQRRVFQGGLLAWLRGDAGGAKTMHRAVAEIAKVTAAPTISTFWWTVGALLEAIIERSLEPGFGVKQLAARIDLQIRRLVEGGTKVADRLRREVLYYVAISAPASPTIAEVQQAFRLRELIPSADALSADAVRLEPLLRRAKDEVATAKDAWVKLASGRAENLARLKQTMATLRAQAAEIGNPALARLAAALATRLDSVPTLNLPEALAMEYATGLLLLESALDGYAGLAPDFPKQVDAMIARLDAAAAGRPVDALPALAQLDEMSRRAQERLLLAQVVREIQVNLRRIEQVLDAFFRDHTKRADLATLAKDSRQVGGALRMLGLDDADRLIALCQVRIDSYARPETAVSDDELELLAEALSSLGFYVEAVEQQRPDRERLILPLVERLSGAAPAARADERAESVEAAVAELRAALPEIVAEVQRAPADAAARTALRTKLTDLIDDARLIGDDNLALQAGAALKELDAGGEAALTAAVGVIAGSGAAAPAPAISAETRRLLATDQKKLDAEFLEIYLDEAAEVLDTIGQHRGLLERNAAAPEALRTVRRGFHTLKGSGRMVGLDALGEIAWDVEKILNRLLDEDRAVTPAVVELIVAAERGFRGWVDELRAAGDVRPDPAPIHAAILTLESELPADRESVLKPRAAPAEAPAEAPRPQAPAFAAVGAAGAPAPVVVEVEAPEATEAHLAGEIPQAAAAATAASVAPPAPAGAEEIAIGGVVLSASLHRVLCDEAALHLATLRAELATLQFDPRQMPSAAMVRASHTLHGIHRTAGFPLVSIVAKALEQCLLRLQQSSAPAQPAAQPVLADAIETLAALAAKLRARSAFDADDEGAVAASAGALDALRPEGGPAPVPEDAELLAAREAADAEDLEVAAASEGHTAAAGESEAVAAAARDAAIAAEREAALAVEREAAAAAAIAATQAAGDPLDGIRDDVDAQVLPIFLEEAAELFPQAGEALRGLRRQPADAANARRLRRTLHTLKGSARMAGAMRLGELTHRMESRLEDADPANGPAPALFDVLESDLDRIAFLLDALREGRVNVALPWVEAAATEPEATVVAGAPAAAPSPVVVPFAARAPAAVPGPAAEENLEADATQRALLRVRADIIDRLANEAGEVAITRSRIDAELRALKANLLELTASVVRLRAQVREIEIQGESQIQSRMSHASHDAQGFDPLEFDRYTRFQELTRSLAEGVNDVATVQQALLKNLDDADAALLAQARFTRDLQQQLFAIRTVPFGSLSERLYRILRQIAKELDKRANLEIRGAQVELDRSVLEKLAGPLEHLMRNALDHGIEPRAARNAAGKSETGEIALTVRQVGNEIAVELSDDGAGLDFDSIRARAQAQGRIAAGAHPTEGELIECIFQPGFSTATNVTAVSGRGIGMDVVRSEVAALGGRVEVATRRGQGTTFLLYLPLTLAVAQAVMVRAGGRLWALPAPMVEQVEQMKPELLRDHYVTRALEWHGTTYPFHYLPRLLGDTQHTPQTARHNPVLLLRAGQGVAAVHVDEMIGNQEVVVKNIGPQLARVSGIAGATVLGNGEIVLIINPVQLAQRAGLPVFDPDAPDRVVAGAQPPAAPGAVSRRPQILIVDDSLTVRKITSRLLSREGFDVLTARDGVDALEILEEHTPDVILLDIEMPRMDGFEFTRTIKADARHSHIPIVMITSRTADKHRARARELGVDLYLGKPFQEEELLRNLREMLALAA